MDRLGLVPKLQVDVKRYSALSLRLDDLANRFNDEFRALERNTASLTQEVVKFAHVVGILHSGSTGSSGSGSLELFELGGVRREFEATCGANLATVFQVWESDYFIYGVEMPDVSG